MNNPPNTTPDGDEVLRAKLRSILESSGVNCDEYLSRELISQGTYAIEGIMSLISAYTEAKVREAEQRPVGDAIEIKVAKETMKAVMSKVKMSDKNIARRVLSPEWLVTKWRDGTADEYDLEVYIWKLKILASLTRKFNWSAFLLEPKNIKWLAQPPKEQS